jgi:circadian clock protein KaiB
MAKRKAFVDSTAAFEKAAKAAASKPMYALRLYVAGINPQSSAAMRSIKEICEKHLKNRYELEIIDIYQQPTLAKGEQIIAVPTLIKKLPEPLRRFIGNLADKERILVGLDLQSRK